MEGILLSLGVIAIGVWLQKKSGGRSMLMSKEWKAGVLPGHIKEEKRYR